MDVESIDPGVDFVARIDEAIKSCGILLSVIGDDWTGGNDPARITQPGDYVRHEVEAALATGIPVVPVLVERARMPTFDELPESLHPCSVPMP
jgi:hypothetical protein